MKYEFDLLCYGNLMENKNVVIANCSENISSAIEKLFSSQGASVYTDKEAKEKGINADALICSVSCNYSGQFEELKTEDIKENIERNLLYNAELIKSHLPHMMEKRCGTIVNIIPQYATHAVSGISATAMVSGALVSLTQAIAMDYCKYNIRANCIEYGILMTEENSYNAELIDMQPLRRLCTGEDIANAALFFSSGMSAFISGDTMPVNGGGFCIGHNNAWDNYLKLI